jgi:uncharacterized protein (TIGR03067 family)
MTRPLSLVAVSFLVLAFFGSPVDHPAGPASVRADEPPPDKAKAREVQQLEARDLKKLQGRWKVVREQVCGQVQEGDRGSYTFMDNTLTFVYRTTRHSGTFTINVSQRPKYFTWTYRNEEDKQETIACIYAFDDDHLLLKYSVYEWKHHDRPPKDFGSNTTDFMRLERTKD